MHKKSCLIPVLILIFDVIMKACCICDPELSWLINGSYLEVIWGVSLTSYKNNVKTVNLIHKLIVNKMSVSTNMEVFHKTSALMI